MSQPNPNIHVTVTFRHTDPTPALRTYATEKIAHVIARYTGYDVEAQIVLSVVKRDHNAEIKLRSKQYDLSASATTGDLYSAIDKMVDNVDTQLRKQKEKQYDRKHQPSMPLEPLE